MRRHLLIWIGMTTAGLAYACAPLLSIDDVTYGAGPATGGDASTATDGASATDAAVVLSCDAIVFDPPSLDFGEVRYAADAAAVTPSVLTLAIRNAGVGARTLHFSASAPFSVQETGPLGLATGESRDLHLAFAPTVAGAATGKLTVTSDDGCTASANLAGTGSTAPFIVSPAKLDFGSVLCGQKATRNVTVDCDATGTGTWSATVPGPFSVAPSGALTPSTTVSIPVQLATPFVGPSPAVEQTLVLTLPDKARNVVVSASGRGGVIAFAAAPPQGNVQTFLATNVGNDVANVSWLGIAGGWSANPSTASIAPGASVTVAVNNNGNYGTVTISAGQDGSKPGAICSTASIGITYDDPNASSSSGASGGGN